MKRHSLGLIGIALGAVYLYWRVTDSLDGAPGWLALPLLSAEVFLYLIYVLDVWATWRDADTPVYRKGAEGRCAVVLTAFSEPETVVRTTLLACQEVRGCDAIYLVDDAHRDDLAHLANRFGATYVARHNPTGGRAGAMAHGLAVVEAEFVAVLTADQVPHPDFIERALAEFDDDVAVVQVGLEYSNTDSVIHTSRTEHDESWQFDVITPAADARGAATWSNSGAVVRTEAIREIGGHPVDSLSGELHATVRLQSLGWRVHYLNEALVTGVAPRNLAGFITQRTGWARGQLQLLASSDSPIWKRGLSLAQRMHHIHTAFSHLTAVAYSVVGVALLITLTQGIVPLRPSLTGAAFFTSWMLSAMAGRVAIGHGTLSPGGTIARNLIMLELRLRALWRVLRRDSRRAGGSGSVTDVGGADVVHHLQILVGFVVALEILLGLRLVDAVIGWPLRPLEGIDLALGLVWGAATASSTLRVVGAFTRRRQEREHRRVGVDYFGSVNGTPAWIVDLSAAGAGAVTTLDVEPGDELSIGVDLVETTVELKGIARSVVPNQDDSRRRVGIQLVDVPEDALDAILLALRHAADRNQTDPAPEQPRVPAPLVRTGLAGSNPVSVGSAPTSGGVGPIGPSSAQEDVSRVKALAASDDSGQISLTVEVDGSGGAMPAVASATASFDDNGKLRITVSQSSIEFSSVD